MVKKNSNERVLCQFLEKNGELSRCLTLKMKEFWL